MSRPVCSVALVALMLPALLWQGAHGGGKAKEDPLLGAMKFVKVPKGTFWRSKDNKNAQERAPIAEDFELAAYTVTQEQWETVMGANPSHFSRKGKGKDVVKDISDADLKYFPVENVSENAVRDFLKKLNDREKGKGWKYIVPSDAQWEYACRGAATSKEECSFDFYLERPTNDLSSKQANFDGNRPQGEAEKGPNLKRPTKVGSYAPNKLGLYDMHGNVAQWTSSGFPFKKDSLNGGAIVRGGGWISSGKACSAGYLGRWGGETGPNTGSPWLGVRLARVPSDSK